jgi:endonuclease G, mitochondrial
MAVARIIAPEEHADPVAARVAERTKIRRRRIRALSGKHGLAHADTAERVGARIDRLSRSYPDVRPVDPARLRAGDPAAVAAAGAILERVVGTEDFVAVRYLQAGVVAGRAVARVSIRDRLNRVVGYGSGSLVSPELLLTNHHVVPDAEVAARSVVEFDYEDGLDGRPLTPAQFGLDPQRLFLADEDLDYALVAVRATPGDLARFGCNRLIEAQGKAIVGDFVTIIQHPGGERKQVALRDNRIVDVLDDHLHYAADTEPGSSGSLVFNDQWEVVALHHASVPAPDGSELGDFVNEGIRASRLVAHVRARPLSVAGRALVDGMFAGPAGAGGPAVPRPEAIAIDPHYANRAGYDERFLGEGPHRVPLPALPPDLVAAAAVNAMPTREPAYVLDYHHFSVAMNRLRRLAFYTAVNIDGATSVRLKRERDRWTVDPRVPADQQTDEDVYRNNPLDRGHLVRRLDPAWGAGRDVAKAGNDDTFHFTNCTPQHEDFNQNQTTWAGLEDHILENADNRDLRVTVLTGPVLADDDDVYRGILLPRQYWKVVAMVKADGSLSATGYLLSQAALIAGLEAARADFSYGAYRTFQVRVADVERLTRLSFGSLPAADPLGRLEAAAIAPIEIDDYDRITL